MNGTRCQRAHVPSSSIRELKKKKLRKQEVFLFAELFHPAGQGYYQSISRNASMRVLSCSVSDCP
jgi:hypothetical protein